jgi:adenine-specific DNA-methyltransferase
MGAFFTPKQLIDPMATWTANHRPDRIVDVGCGTGRFTVEAARLNPRSEIVAVDIDPLATILTRASLSVLGHRDVAAHREDFTQMRLPPIDGCTAFLGNPPYVRHHDLTADIKAWAQKTAVENGYEVSALAGLHALFYLATANHAKTGDIGCFVTSSEWLDVDYGAIARRLFLKELGGQSPQ